MSLNSKVSNSEKVRKLVYLAVLTALVVILQLVASAIPVGVCNLSFVLVPIVIGAAFCGPLAGAWLGLTFAVVVLCQPATSFFYSISTPGTIVTVIVKGVAAGLLTGFVYRALARFNRYVSVLISALVCPTVNTGLFVLGCRLFFYEAFAAAAVQESLNVTAYVLLFVVGINFFVEVGINVVLAPVIMRLVNIRKHN